ncbi:hypothetical protein HDU87_001502, partial [Geranomyces variabilis]
MICGPFSPMHSRDPYFPTPAAPPVQPVSAAISAAPLHRRSVYESPPPVYSDEPIAADTIQTTIIDQNGETSHRDSRVAEANVPVAADGPPELIGPTTLADKPKRKRSQTVLERHFETDKSTGHTLQDLPTPFVPLPTNQAALDSLLIQGAVTGPQYLEMREKLSALEALD